MRRRGAVVLVLTILVALTACQPARAGARCRTKDWGKDAKYVLQCKSGRWKRVMTIRQATTIMVALLSKPAEGQVVRPASLPSPQLPNMADPDLLVEGGVTYIYGTTNFRHVPVVPLTDLDRTYSQNELYSATGEAMPNLPVWASRAQIWAPTVAKIGGRYVMFFAAPRKSPPDPSNEMCVGRAFAPSPTGPFDPESVPVTCGNDGVHGALDPSVFIAPNGSARLMVAMGGSTTNIWTFPIDANSAIVGPAVSLAARDRPWERVFLENPSMYYDGSTYLLAYSNDNWEQPNYNTGIARCSSPTGPCTDRADGPWLATLGGRAGPGALDFFVGPDGAPRVAYESYATGDYGPIGKRSVTIQRLYTDPWPRLG